VAGDDQPDRHRDARLGRVRPDLHAGAELRANLIQSRNFRAFEAYIIATAIYLALSVALRRLLNWLGPRSSACAASRWR
jgi:hypothetical protein